MANTIKFKVEITNKITIKLIIDGEEMDLYFNPQNIFTPLIVEKKPLFINTMLDEFDDTISVNYNDDYIFWGFPYNQIYGNLSGKELCFNREDYIEENRNVLYQLVNQTNSLSGVDRESINILDNNLKYFIMSNKEKISELLAL